MKRVIPVILLTVSLVAFTGCSSRGEKYDDNSAPQAFNLVMAESYTLSGKCSGITPFGATASEDSVIICDMENNCLREFDFQGNQKTQFILNGYTDCEQDGREDLLSPTGRTMLPIF